MDKALHILLIEDNPGDAGLVREALREHNIPFEMALASDGAEAESYLSRMGKTIDAPCPDLILLDLNLPKVGGHEVLASFRAHPLCTLTPVIVLTSSNAPRDRELAIAMGAARYFRKPSDLPDFLRLGSVIREVATEAGIAFGGSAFERGKSAPAFAEQEMARGNSPGFRTGVRMVGPCTGLRTSGNPEG